MQEPFKWLLLISFPHHRLVDIWTDPPLERDWNYMMRDMASTMFHLGYVRVSLGLCPLSLCVYRIDGKSRARVL